MVAQRSADFTIFEDLQDNVEEVLELLHKLLVELQSPLLKNYIIPAAKKMEQICLKSLLQRLGKLLVDVITQNIRKRSGNKNSSKQLAGGKKKSKRRNW